MKTQSSAKPSGFIRLSVALLAAMVFGVLADEPRVGGAADDQRRRR